MGKYSGGLSRPRTVFGRETKFTGTLRFDESLKIDGRFEGAIKTSGFLMVEADAVVIADIEAGTLVVGGIIQGNVQVKKRLEILSGGRIIGNIRCPNLVAADGTSIQGWCEMLEESTGIDVFSMPSERLKKTLVSVD